MNKWLCLVCLLLMSGCVPTRIDRVANGTALRCLSNGVIPERACFHTAQEVVGLEGQAASPVNVHGGYLSRRDGIYLISPDSKADGAFFVLDTAALPPDVLPYGLLPLVGWQTVQFGYFTSADIEQPALAGAAGTLDARSIGFRSDPARPAGPHREIVRRQQAARKSDAPQVILALAATGEATRTCRDWKLDERQGTRFFRLSQPTTAVLPGLATTSSCRIEGLVEADGHTWEFMIQADGNATWTHAGDVRHWFCGVPECAELLRSRLPAK